MKKIALIARDTADSPNMAANDAAILERIATELQQRGTEVIYISEEHAIPHGTDAICTMSRTAGTIELLKQAEAEGITVINPTAAVENCSRIRFMEILRENNIPQPQFRAVNSANELDNAIFPCWIKKSKGWSNHSNDVTFATTMQEASAAIQEMNSRGITGHIQMQHCPGDIIKFYGIGNHFFHHCYPVGGKFGKEEINGVPKHYVFSSDRLKDIAQRAAQAIGVDIYGGDAIITPQGEILIIDMNDFPSFTAIRDIAAREITTLIIDKLR